MKRKYVLTPFAVTAILSGISMFFCAGCEKGGGSSEPVAVAGTWEGTRILEGGTVQSEELNLSQNGNAVSGDLDGTPVSGTVSGNRLSLSGSAVRGDGVLLPKKLTAKIEGISLIGTETWGIGAPGSGTVWLKPMSVSLYLASK